MPALTRKLATASPGFVGAQRDLDASLDKLGKVALRAGDVKAARGWYEEGLGIRRGLAAARPGSVEAQRDLAIGVDKLGDVAGAAGTAVKDKVADTAAEAGEALKAKVSSIRHHDDAADGHEPPAAHV